jgi:hypothetical protein
MQRYTVGLCSRKRKKETEKNRNTNYKETDTKSNVATNKRKNFLQEVNKFINHHATSISNYFYNISNDRVE